MYIYIAYWLKYTGFQQSLVNEQIDWVHRLDMWTLLALAITYYPAHYPFSFYFFMRVCLS